MQNLVQNLYCDGIINDEIIEQLKEMKKRQELLKKHPYAITKLPDGRFNTYIKVDGKRKNIKAASMDKLLDKLEFYNTDWFLENLTIDKLYFEWIEYKKAITQSPNTILRHNQHYNKYFKGTEFFLRQVKRISSMELNIFCNELVKSHGMSSHEWANVKTILIGMFDYAEQKNYISADPMAKVKITVKYRQVNRKSGSDETFNSDEIKKLTDYLSKRYETEHDSSYLAIKANLYLGLRVGELVALTWGDIGEKHISVWKTEVTDKKTNKCYVVPHTKTSRNRYVVLVPEAKKIFDLIGRGQDSDYVFTRNGERANSFRINYILKKYAVRSNMAIKSSHKLRKTYASILQANGIPIEEISRQLGHSNTRTTLAYLYNPLTDNDTYDKISSALSSNVVN